MIRFAIFIALLFAALSAAAISFTLTRASKGLCVILSGPGTKILVPGRGC